MEYKVLELYSGIGGMHCALNASGIRGEVIAAVDINTVANRVYRHNFPSTVSLNRNIESFTPDVLNDLNPDVVLMSPPCQPFTRNGLQNDTADPRTDSFLMLTRSFRECPNLKYLLVENVKGFETSKMRDNLIGALETSGFHCVEFLLSPNQFGIPNSRLRYYCLARRKKFSHASLTSELMYDLPNKSVKYEEPFEIGTILEKDLDEGSFLLSPKQLKKAFALDLCYENSRRSCCFTKAYGHFLEGTGSVYSKLQKTEVDPLFQSLQKMDINSEGSANLLNRLQLRFFTPREILRLMCFPSTFQFPSDVSNRQSYKLLGNSINVEVVSQLLIFLINCE